MFVGAREKSIAGIWETKESSRQRDVFAAKMTFYADGVVIYDRDGSRNTGRYKVTKGRFKDEFNNVKRYEVVISNIKSDHNVSIEQNIRVVFFWDGGESFVLMDNLYEKRR